MSPFYKRNGKPWGHLSRVLLDQTALNPLIAEVVLPSGRIEQVSWTYLEKREDGYRLKVGDGELALFPRMTSTLASVASGPERNE